MADTNLIQLFGVWHIVVIEAIRIYSVRIVASIQKSSDTHTQGKVPFVLLATWTWLASKVALQLIYDYLLSAP